MIILVCLFPYYLYTIKTILYFSKKPQFDYQFTYLYYSVNTKKPAGFTNRLQNYSN